MINTKNQKINTLINCKKIYDEKFVFCTTIIIRILLFFKHDFLIDEFFYETKSLKCLIP